MQVANLFYDRKPVFTGFLEDREWRLGSRVFKCWTSCPRPDRRRVDSRLHRGTA